MDAVWEDAIKGGDLQQVRLLLDRGTDPDSLNRYGQTALMLAAHAGQDELVKILIAEGTRLNVTAKYGLSALMLAIVAGHANVARLLADAGADLTIQGTGAPGFAGKTAYDLAVQRDMGELAEALRLKATTP